MRGARAFIVAELLVALTSSSAGRVRAYGSQSIG